MTNKVHIVSSTAASLPLIVVEPDVGEAEETFLIWISVHEPGWDKGAIRIEPMSRIWLAQRPQLAHAVEKANQTGWSGVAYFLSHEEGWVIRAAHEDRIGVIAPYKPEVRYYQFGAAEDDDHDAMVFAHHLDEAVEIYREWHVHAHGRPCLQFTSRAVSRWHLTGQFTSLRHDMDRGQCGIAGLVSGDGTWRILPPHHRDAGGGI